MDSQGLNDLLLSQVWKPEYDRNGDETARKYIVEQSRRPVNEIPYGPENNITPSANLSHSVLAHYEDDTEGGYDDLMVGYTGEDTAPAEPVALRRANCPVVQQFENYGAGNNNDEPTFGDPSGDHYFLQDRAKWHRRAKHYPRNDWGEERGRMQVSNRFIAPDDQMQSYFEVIHDALRSHWNPLDSTKGRANGKQISRDVYGELEQMRLPSHAWGQQAYGDVQHMGKQIWLPVSKFFESHGGLDQDLQSQQLQIPKHSSASLFQSAMAAAILPHERQHDINVPQQYELIDIRNGKIPTKDIVAIHGLSEMLYDLTDGKFTGSMGKRPDGLGPDVTGAGGRQGRSEMDWERQNYAQHMALGMHRGQVFGDVSKQYDAMRGAQEDSSRPSTYHAEVSIAHKARNTANMDPTIFNFAAKNEGNAIGSYAVFDYLRVIEQGNPQNHMKHQSEMVQQHRSGVGSQYDSLPGMMSKHQSNQSDVRPAGETYMPTQDFEGGNVGGGFFGVGGQHGVETSKSRVMEDNSYQTASIANEWYTA
jgi:hypothetical protein